MKIKNIILTMALMGCSTLAFGQTVEQRMDSLQLLIGQQTILHLKATARKGARIVLPSFKPQDQIVSGVEVVEQSKGDTMQGFSRMFLFEVPNWHLKGGFKASRSQFAT